MNPFHLLARTGSSIAESPGPTLPLTVPPPLHKLRWARWLAVIPRCFAALPKPPGSAPGRLRPVPGSSSMPRCSVRPQVEVPWPGRPSIAGRSKFVVQQIFGVALFQRSVQTGIPRPISVLARVPGYTAGNTDSPKDPLPRRPVAAKKYFSTRKGRASICGDTWANSPAQ